MRLGVNVPCTGQMPIDPGLAEIGRAAEAAGAESLWVSDHLMSIDTDTDTYPYSHDGRPTWPADRNIFESLTCCAFLLAATSTCRVGTGVLVLPQRNLFEFAKVTASIDRLSGGRLVLGVGAGWDPREFDALGYDFSTRGARFDEMLAALPGCYGGRPTPMTGTHVRVPEAVAMYPLPAQPDGPPLLVGGSNRRALRRAAQLGTGWYGIAFVRSLDLDALAGSLLTLAELAQAAPRPMPPWGSLKLHAYNEDEFARLPRIALDMERLGFDELVIDLPWDVGMGPAMDTLGSVREALQR